MKGFNLCFCVRVIDEFTIVEQKDEEVNLYREKFAGSQADRIIRAEAENVAEQLRNTNVSGVFSFHF